MEIIYILYLTSVIGTFIALVYHDYKVRKIFKSFFEESTTEPDILATKGQLFIFDLIISIVPFFNIWNGHYAIVTDPFDVAFEILINNFEVDIIDKSKNKGHRENSNISFENDYDSEYYDDEFFEKVLTDIMDDGFHKNKDDGDNHGK